MVCSGSATKDADMLSWPNDSGRFFIYLWFCLFLVSFQSSFYIWLPCFIFARLIHSTQYLDISRVIRFLRFLHFLNVLFEFHSWFARFVWFFDFANFMLEFVVHFVSKLVFYSSHFCSNLNLLKILNNSHILSLTGWCPSLLFVPCYPIAAFRIRCSELRARSYFFLMSTIGPYMWRGGFADMTSCILLAATPFFAFCIFRYKFNNSIFIF